MWGRALLMVLLGFAATVAAASETPAQPTVRLLLEAFVSDYREDPSSRGEPVTFGIEVAEEGAWHVVVDGGGGVALEDGAAPDRTFVYVTDRATLEAVHGGELAALTAMGRARWSDPAPMDLRFMDGFAPDPAFMGRVAELTFHFWTTGLPEQAPFGDAAATRVVHGADVAVLYYQPGLRTAWYRIREGQHVNHDEADQTNPFPTLIIMTSGAADARIGGRELTLESGTCTLVPAGVSHELWSRGTEPAELVIVMFGDGA